MRTHVRSFEMTGTTRVSTCALQAPPGLSSLTESQALQTHGQRACALIRRCGDPRTRSGQKIRKVAFLAFNLYPWSARGPNDRTHVLRKLHPRRPRELAQLTVWPDRVLVSNNQLQGKTVVPSLVARYLKNDSSETPLHLIGAVLLTCSPLL